MTFRLNHYVGSTTKADKTMAHMLNGNKETKARNLKSEVLPESIVLTYHISFHSSMTHIRFKTKRFMSLHHNWYHLETLFCL